MNLRWVAIPLLLALGWQATQTTTPQSANEVRRVPPLGVPIAAADRAELEAGVANLNQEIERLREQLKVQPALLDLLPDVEIYSEAVRAALAYDEFFDLKEVPVAKTLLAQGRERARLLGEGKAPWTTQTGLVVRGYRSKIDGSVQPYGLVVPASYQAGTGHQHRLDIWLHGRNEKLSEVNFIAERQKSAGQFTPRDAFVLHPYGRYCNAFRFAGEVDVMEALAHARKHYPIDEDRLTMRGFSMGGAGCWMLATHYAGMWAAAAPGAGFAESAEYLKLAYNQQGMPPAYEQKLWHLYDSTDYALNLFNLPTVAYSGEIDRQKQAADVMARELKKEGIELVHIIGPQTEHKYHPDSIPEINRRIDGIVERGRNPVPRAVKFTTWSLRYNQMLWVTVDGLQAHWERARVDAEIKDATHVDVKTSNVSALTLEMPSGLCPLDNSRRPTVTLDGQQLEAPAVASDRSWTAHFRRTANRWAVVPSSDDGGLAKRHGLQGPIDDAFMDSFVMVRPTGKPMNEAVGAWVNGELAHAVEHWRRQFRGAAREKADTEITADDIAQHNLILWGDPSSNQILAQIADQLPIRWDGGGVRVGAQSFSSSSHVPLLIFPNPLNPNKYVLLNSSVTFREYDYLTNARQYPHLPDYAIVDVSAPVTMHAPGRIVTAGFFGERWELPEMRRGQK